MKSLHEIWLETQPLAGGLARFVHAVETHCDLPYSRAEIARIAAVSTTPEEFERILEQEIWWTDDEN